MHTSKSSLQLTQVKIIAIDEIDEGEFMLMLMAHAPVKGGLMQRAVPVCKVLLCTGQMEYIIIQDLGLVYWKNSGVVYYIIVNFRAFLGLIHYDT